MKITIDVNFLEHLLNCLDNQKFLPLPEQQVGYELENQEVIDLANRMARTFLYLSKDRYSLEELSPYLAASSSYIREAALGSFDRQQSWSIYLDEQLSKIIDENSKYLSGDW